MKLKLPIQAVQSSMALCREFCFFATAAVSVRSTSLVGFVPSLDSPQTQFKNQLSTVSSWIQFPIDNLGRTAAGLTMEPVFATSRGLITNRSTN